MQQLQKTKVLGTRLFRSLVWTQAVLIGGVILVASVRQNAVFFDFKARFGFDFEDFFRAAEVFLKGGNPYAEARFNKPPWVVLFSVLLQPLGMGAATLGMFCLNLGALLTSIILMARRFLGVSEVGETLGWGVLAWVAVLFGFPGFFLLDRGNLDGLVALFCALYFCGWSVRGGEGENEPVDRFRTGVFLGIAACLKLYPILLILPALLFRRYRMVAGFGATILVSLLSAPILWFEFVTSQQLLGRLTYNEGAADNGSLENGSLANTFALLSGFFSDSLPASQLARWAPLGWAVFGLMVIGMLIFDHRLRSRVPKRMQGLLALSYVPPMVLVPKTVYLYEYVHFLPWAAAIGSLLGALDLSSLKGRRYLPEIWGVGLGLTQFPVAAGLQAWGGAPPWRLCLIPGVAALSLAMLASVGLRLWILEGAREATPTISPSVAG